MIGEKGIRDIHIYREARANLHEKRRTDDATQHEKGTPTLIVPECDGKRYIGVPGHVPKTALLASV